MAICSQDAEHITYNKRISLIYVIAASKRTHQPRVQILAHLIVVTITNGAVINSPRNQRLAQAEWNNYNYKEPTGAGTYAFGYDIEDSETSNVQYKNEERHPNGSVTGSYGYLMPDGSVQRVSYIADEHGYRATVKISSRGNIKPIQVGAPENALFDFSANIPPQSLKSVPSSNTPARNQITQGFPYNIPNYISSHLENQNTFPQGGQNQRNYWMPYVQRF